MEGVVVHPLDHIARIGDVKEGIRIARIIHEAGVRLYNRLGAREYAIFDPRFERRPHPAGYRRAPDGGWEPWPVDEHSTLRSPVLELTLVQDGMLLRLEDLTGRRLPTAAEEIAAEQTARQAAEEEAAQL